MPEQAPASSGDHSADGTREVQAAIEAFRSDYASVREQVGRVVVGQSEIIDGVLTAMFCGGHALLEGVPGIGKTLLVRTLAQALHLDFGRVQFTPDLMPADITGTTVVHEVDDGSGKTVREFRFQAGPIFAQTLLADEINRATPKTQAAMLEAMQERSVTVAGTTHQLPKPFFVLATQNPLEQEGTYPLPEAQLDRFFFKLEVGYASREDMREILERTTGRSVPEPEPVLDAERILTHQSLVRRAAAPAPVQDYAVRLVLATHPRGKYQSDGPGFSTPMVDDYVRVGASPRAAQALLLAAKCRALLDGRTAASTDDVRWAVLPALRHRILLNFEADAEGVTGDAIVENLAETVPVRSEAAASRP
ncbi:MAG: MoxR family ATPase [Planctomycetota bacterium]